MAGYALLRLRHRQEQAEPVTEVNIIPVIDISLVLLVILFVTAPLLSVPNVAVELPRASAPEDSAPTVAVTLTRDGALSVRAAEVAWADLGAALAGELKRSPDSGVVLRVDKTVQYRHVQRLMEAAQKAGAKKVSFGTEPAK